MEQARHDRSFPTMSGLLFPQDDVGVAIQIGVLAAIVAIGLVVTRRNRDLRLLVGGVGLLLFSLIAIQAVH